MHWPSTFGVPAGALLAELASSLDPARSKGEHDLLRAYRALAHEAAGRVAGGRADATIRPPRNAESAAKR